MPDERPTTILVAFDSRRGTVERLAEAVADGARSVPGTAVAVKRVDEIGRDDLANGAARRDVHRSLLAFRFTLSITHVAAYDARHNGPAVARGILGID